VSINNLIAVHDENSGPAGYDLVQRIGTMDPRAFIDELRRAGIVVSSPDES
jgi:hypothetical protein